MVEKFEKSFGQNNAENPDQGIKEPTIDPDSGVVLTPKEAEEEKIRKGDDPNWYREQK